MLVNFLQNENKTTNEDFKVDVINKATDDDFADDIINHVPSAQHSVSIHPAQLFHLNSDPGSETTITCGSNFGICSIVFSWFYCNG